MDEVQYVPKLFSYVQLYSDEHEKPGYFVLTGSQNFLLMERITQSLAGRIALFTLLPLSLAELKNASLLPKKVDELLFQGEYPRLYGGDIEPTDWYPDYIATYLERDVRNLRNVTDLSKFRLFLGMCAGRIGQLLNISSLSKDCGIMVPTIKSWLSIL